MIVYGRLNMGEGTLTGNVKMKVTFLILNQNPKLIPRRTAYLNKQ